MKNTFLLLRKRKSHGDGSNKTTPKNNNDNANSSTTDIVFFSSSQIRVHAYKLSSSPSCDRVELIHTYGYHCETFESWCILIFHGNFPINTINHPAIQPYALYAFNFVLHLLNLAYRVRRIYVYIIFHRTIRYAMQRVCARVTFATSLNDLSLYFKCGVIDTQRELESRYLRIMPLQ